MNNRRKEIEIRLSAISIRTKQLFDFEIRNENRFDVSSVKAERNALYLEAIDLEDELEGLPIEANPNRFIKSSFSISLLWVAKFYRSLCDSYKKNCNQELSAWRSSMKAFQLYRYYLGLSTDFMTIDSPYSYRWFRA